MSANSSCMSQELQTDPSAPASTSVPEITQEEIRRLRQFRNTKREGDRLRDSIRDRLRSGAVVEPGPLYVRIEEQKIRSLSKTALQAIFGADWVDQVRAQIEPTTNIRIMIDDDS